MICSSVLTDRFHPEFGCLYLGISSGDWRAEAVNAAKLQVKQQLVFYHIMNVEGLKPTAAEYDALFNEYFEAALEEQHIIPDRYDTNEEYEAAKEYGAIFLMQIGGKLKSGKPHDGRAPDYDDWSLNGDIIVYYPVLDIALELSSMGVRVDEETLVRQLEERGCPERAELAFHKALLNGELPYTIGGGIGQSRLCMFFLRKAHIGEVQSSYWTPEEVAYCKENGVYLL